MSDIKLNVLEDSSTLQKGLFLWLLNVEQIPHLAISLDGHYFSLKISGVDFDLDTNLVYNLIEVKKLKTLFFKLDVDLKLNEIKDLFSNLDTVNESNSCLFPLKMVFDIDDALTVHDLLDEFNERNIIDGVLGKNVDLDFITIPEYSREDVITYIKSRKRSDA